MARSAYLFTSYLLPLTSYLLPLSSLNFKIRRTCLTKPRNSYKMLHSEMEYYDENCKKCKKMFGRIV